MLSCEFDCFVNTMLNVFINSIVNRFKVPYPIPNHPWGTLFSRGSKIWFKKIKNVPNIVKISLRLSFSAQHFSGMARNNDEKSADFAKRMGRKPFFFCSSLWNPTETWTGSYRTEVSNLRLFQPSTLAPVTLKLGQYKNFLL